LEIVGFSLETSSRGAKAANRALPHGRLSMDSLTAQAKVKLSCHIPTRDKEHHMEASVKKILR
jgi:hypothetical protein